MKSIPRSLSLCGGVVVWMSCNAAAQVPEMSKQVEADISAVLYEHRYDPSFEGDVHFIDKVPLIAPDAGCEATAQFWTSLLAHSRRMARIVFFERIGTEFGKAAARHEGFQRLPERTRYAVGWEVLNDALGAIDSSLIPPDVDAEGHTHAKGEEQAHATARSGAGGLHSLRTIDARLKNASDQGKELRSILRAPGAEWKILLREQVPLDQCERNLRSHFPFVSHREDRNYLICGFAIYRSNHYLIGFDISEIERRVVLGGGATSVPYSDFLRIRSEAQGRDPNINFDPLFLDYESYFSRKNAPGFRLLPARNVETISTLFPVNLNNESLAGIFETRIKAAITREGLQKADPAP